MVRFWMDAYKNPTKSAEAGRAIYDTIPWCEIRVPGESDTVSGPVHRMQPDPRVRFPGAWAAFEKDNASEGLVGTPIRFVPWIERGDVENLAHSGIKTLEQLASVTDGNLSNIPGGIALRQKAKDFIRTAKDSAPLERMSEELQKRDLIIEGLRAQVSEILKAKGLTDAPEVKVRKKPGPKPKNHPLPDAEH